jgi:hypothetical protein
MLTDPAVLIADFSAAAGALSMDGWPCTLHGGLSVRSASSGGPAAGFGAVCAFALSARTTSAAGAGMVLKVGKGGLSQATTAITPRRSLPSRWRQTPSLVVSRPISGYRISGVPLRCPSEIPPAREAARR